MGTLKLVTEAHDTARSIHVVRRPEFISKDLHVWAHMNGVILDVSRTGKLTDHAYALALNRKDSAKCIDQELVPVGR